MPHSNIFYSRIYAFGMAHNHITSLVGSLPAYLRCFLIVLTVFTERSITGFQLAQRGP